MLLNKDMGPVLNANKKEQRGAKFKSTFLILKTINSTVINVITYQLKTLKCSFISP